MSKGLAVLAAAVGAAAAALVSAAIVSARGTAAATTKTIATTSSVDYRAVVIAHRLSGGRAPRAGISVVVSTKSGKRWTRARSRVLVGTFFWKTVTGPRAVCRLLLATAPSNPSGPPSVVVQLLQTPSLGCGRPITVLLPNS